MKRPTFAVLGVFVVVLLAGCSSSTVPGSSVPGGAAGQADSASVLSTQTVEAGGVTVEATWEDRGTGLSFHVKLDNHQIDLDEVTLNGAVLANDRGDRLEAREWAAPPGGHHREGSLLFKGAAGPFLSGAKWVELTLPPIGSNSVPSLRWSLGGSS